MRNRSHIQNCCRASKKQRKCKRMDGKVFSLPRRFSRKQCMTQKIRGFSMRSSCAPYRFCRRNGVHKSTRRLKRKS